MRMARLIGEGLFHPVFQPIVDIQRAQIAGFEALTRPHAESGFTDAGKLFDAAEHTGTIWPLEQVTRRAAFGAAANWQPDILLFMNCSPSVFADERFADEFQSSVQRTPGLTPGRVVLEITERTEQGHFEGLARQVRLLRERGFQIAIDDVGAGTSGLNRIMRLRPNWLKLDRDLIESIDKDRVKQNLIRFLVHFARLSGVQIIAEGVERSEELAILMDLGIVHAQGYYLGRPGSRDQMLSGEVVEWMRKRWTEVQSCRLSRPAGQRISRLIRPAKIVDGGCPVADVASILHGDAALTGVVVVEGARCVGWADKDWVIERTHSEHAGYPIAAILPAGSTLIAPDDSITDAVDQLGSRDPRNASHPLIAFDAGHVHGIVTVSDVLSTVAEMTRNPLVRTAPITGMPGRVRADEYLDAQISQSRTAYPARPSDAAVIDIRHFSDYNGAYGYELGDQLLQELSNAIRAELMQPGQRAFVAHLSDDHFLVTAPAGTLQPHLASLVQRFEATVAALSAGPVQHTASDGYHPRSIGLRIVLIPGALGRVEDARSLFRLANHIRESAENGGDRGRTLGVASQLLTDRAPAAALRRTA